LLAHKLVVLEATQVRCKGVQSVMANVPDASHSE
jgi:hypothetical protein